MSVKTNDPETPNPSSLLREERGPLVRFLTRMVGERDAEDLTQQVLLKATHGLSGFRGDASPRAWLFGIATNAARDWLRNLAHSWEPIESLGSDGPPELADAPSQERHLARQQMSQCVGEFLARLPESYRTVIALSDCTVRIEKTRNTCSLCEEHAKRQAQKPIVVMSCEGACLRGEISRQAANHLCHVLAPEKTVRLCLGSAFTKDGGQRALVRGAKRVIALDGCLVRCASRMMRGPFPSLKSEVILTDGLCDFDRSLYGAEELPADEVQRLGLAVAAKVAARL
jgi:RNA polymerase sigma factor (sigma-70 family)